jgi:hypothetical protein
MGDDREIDMVSEGNLFYTLENTSSPVPEPSSTLLVIAFVASSLRGRRR